MSELLYARNTVLLDQMRNFAHWKKRWSEIMETKAEIMQTELVIPASQMKPQHFENHMLYRHSWLRFATRGEHLADHRLHPMWQDHWHEEEEA